MKRRTTENVNHNFQKKLYNNLNAFDLQGLTMNKSRDGFIAGIEYFDLTSQEYKLVKSNPYSVFEMDTMLSHDLIKAQAIFTKQLKVPLYYIWGYKNDKNSYHFLRDEIHLNDNRMSNKFESISLQQLIKFWRKIKPTHQTNPYDKNGAKYRAEKTRIDEILEEHGLEWGGNIDGFIIKDKKVIAIIDCISIGEKSQTNTHGLNDPNADPALYFKRRGPKYETWLSTVTLAKVLNVPHLLLTLNKVNQNQEAIGLTAIDHLSSEGIFYNEDIAPNANVVQGLNNIHGEIFKLLKNLKPPQIY